MKLNLKLLKFDFGFVNTMSSEQKEFFSFLFKRVKKLAKKELKILRSVKNGN